MNQIVHLIGESKYYAEWADCGVLNTGVDFLSKQKQLTKPKALMGLGTPPLCPNFHSNEK